MGDRGQVHIKDSGVWLYTHWGASNLTKDVKQALSKRWRWSDYEYLSRIIFDEMIGTEHGKETGFGIGSEQHGDVWCVIIIDCENQTVTINENDSVVLEQTFEEFIGT